MRFLLSRVFPHISWFTNFSSCKRAALYIFLFLFLKYLWNFNLNMILNILRTLSRTTWSSAGVLWRRFSARCLKFMHTIHESLSPLAQRFIFNCLDYYKLLGVPPPLHAIEHINIKRCEASRWIIENSVTFGCRFKMQSCVSGGAESPLQLRAAGSSKTLEGLSNQK